MAQLDTNTPHYQWHITPDPQWGWWSYLTITQHHQTHRIHNSARWRPTKKWAYTNGRRRTKNHQHHHTHNHPNKYNRNTQEPR